MKTWMALGALIVVLGITGKAHAENPCMKDMETLCAGVEPGEGRLHKCMMEIKTNCRRSVKLSTRK